MTKLAILAQHEPLWAGTADFAATLAPTPDAMVNPAKLALSPQVAGCRLQVAARSENPRG